MMLLLLLLSATLVTFSMDNPMKEQKYDYCTWIPTLVPSDKQKKEEEYRNLQKLQEAMARKIRKKKKEWKKKDILPPV